MQSDLTQGIASKQPEEITVDEILVSKIANGVESEWQMSGLSGGLYEDYACEILKRYLCHIPLDYIPMPNRDMLARYTKTPTPLKDAD